MFHQILMFVTTILMKIWSRDHWRDIILVLFFVLFWVFSWIIEEVIMRCMLAKMVPSTTQSFVETLRNGVSRVSTILASITAPLVMNFLHWWSTTLIVVVALLLLAFVVRRRELCDIHQIDFHLDNNVEDGKEEMDGGPLRQTYDETCYSDVNEAFQEN